MDPPSTQMELLKILAGFYLMGSDNGFHFEAPNRKVCASIHFIWEPIMTMFDIFGCLNIKAIL